MNATRISPSVASGLGSANAAVGAAVGDLIGAIGTVAGRAAAAGAKQNEALHDLEWNKTLTGIVRDADQNADSDGTTYQNLPERIGKAWKSHQEKFPAAGRDATLRRNVRHQPRILRTGNAAIDKYRNTQLNKYTGIENQKLDAGLASLREDPSNDNFMQLTTDLTQLVNSGEGVYRNPAQTEARRNEVWSKLATERAQALLKSDPAAAKALFDRVQQLQSQAKPEQQSSIDYSGILTSGRARKKSSGWARTNSQWQRLGQFEKAAAMSLMEADGMRKEDARNALGAMINRAAKNKEDLGAHVSNKIYQPTIEPAQERRLGRILKSKAYKELVAWGKRRAAGLEKDPVNGATHFLAHAPVMLKLSKGVKQVGTDKRGNPIYRGNSRKYYSWPGWSGFDPKTGKYKNQTIIDRSHSFLAPHGKFSHVGDGVSGKSESKSAQLNALEERRKSGDISQEDYAQAKAAIKDPQGREVRERQDLPIDPAGLTIGPGGEQQGFDLGRIISEDEYTRLQAVAQQNPDARLSEVLDNDDIAALEKFLPNQNIGDATVGDIAALYGQVNEAQGQELNPGIPNLFSPEPESQGDVQQDRDGVIMIKGEKGDYAFLPEHLKSVGKNFWRSYSRQSRERLTAVRRERENVAKQMIERQIANLERTGNSYSEFDPEVIRQAYAGKPEKIAQFNSRQEIAKRTYLVRHDMHDTSSGDLRTRLNDLEEDVIDDKGDVDIEAAKAYDRARDDIERLIALRETDPGRAVMQSEEVKSYLDSLKTPGQPDTAAEHYGLVDAMINAQTRLGIKPTPLSKRQANNLLAPLSTASERDRPRVARELAERIHRVYKEHAQLVLNSAIALSNKDNSNDRYDMRSRFRQLPQRSNPYERFESPSP